MGAAPWAGGRLARGRTWSLACRSSPGAGTRRILLLAGGSGDGWDVVSLPARRRRPSAFPIPPPGSSPSDRTARLRLSIRVRFSWNDASWAGVVASSGRCSTKCTSARSPRKAPGCAAIEQLPALADLGITTIEMMPVAEFAGRRGWGYDGVDLFAPSHLYGVPDDLRRFVDAAHRPRDRRDPRRRLQPSRAGRQFPAPVRAGLFLAAATATEWGEAINFDDDAAPVREFMIANAAYWIDEFHLDGLRLDATQQIFDASATHVLADMARRARAAARGAIHLLVAENEPQDVRLLRPHEQGGFGFDALWNDDFHHAAVVALTGRREAYYTDYCGTPQEFAVAGEVGIPVSGPALLLAEGAGAARRRVGLRRCQFITFLENHDQIANAPDRPRRTHPSECQPGHVPRADGDVAAVARRRRCSSRARSLPHRRRSCTLPIMAGRSVRRCAPGRAEFMSQFRSTATRRSCRRVARSCTTSDTFRRCKLRHAERAARTRRRSPFIAICCGCAARIRSSRDARPGWMDGAVLSRSGVRHAMVCRAIRTATDRSQRLPPAIA